MIFWEFEMLEKCRGTMFQIAAKKGVWKIEQLPKTKSPLSAIHKLIWHIWEDGSRKVNVNEPNLRIYHGNVWPVISQAVRKPCFSTSIPRGQIPRFPDAAAGAAGRTLKSRSRPLPTHPGMKCFRKETLAVDDIHAQLNYVRVKASPHKSLASKLLLLNVVSLEGKM